MEQDAVDAVVERLETLGLRVWLALLALGGGYDVWAFLRHRQTLSSAVWLIQQSRWKRSLLRLTWFILSFHFFLEPVLTGRVGHSQWTQKVAQKKISDALPLANIRWDRTFRKAGDS